MLRVLAESFVVSPPSGVTIKTRLRQGKLDAHGRAQSRKVRKKYLTAQSSSRWAGSITRATQDQYDLAVRALACLLYTSDAADDLTRVDLGGRRIIKKKKTK